MQKFIIKFTKERLITPSGLTFVGAMAKQSGLIKECNKLTLSQKRSQPHIKNGEILLSYIALLCQGKTDFEAVKEMRDDPAFFETALGLRHGIPSPETLRQRMNIIGDNFRSTILNANVNMFRSYPTMKPTPLETGLVPVDIDVTPKEFNAFCASILPALAEIQYHFFASLYLPSILYNKPNCNTASPVASPSNAQAFS